MSIGASTGWVLLVAVVGLAAGGKGTCALSWQSVS